jgi:hypothetical protein
VLREGGGPALIYPWFSPPAESPKAMLPRLFVLLTCLATVPTAARAESWRSRVELIHEWSLFTCSMVRDRYWQFTLEGSTLRGTGPEGNAFTARVAPDGAFKADVINTYSHTGTDRVDKNLVQATGNLTAGWMHLHIINFDCWYRLVRQP